MPHAISVMLQFLQRLHATNATLLRCCRDCSDVLEIAAMLHLLHVIAVMLHLPHATNAHPQTFKSTTVQVLENTPGTRSGTESLIEGFLHNTRIGLWVMLVVPLLNSSICYFSFTWFMCFFPCLEQKRK
jgi:hypothetical protein